MVRRNAIRSILALGISALAWVVMAAVPFGQDGVDRTDPNFVTASLLVFGPGEELYGCAGHVAFRLECPRFNLDYAFSYEGEPVADQVLRFFAGKLKMGMFAVETPIFLEQYRKTGRGAMQYRMNLSPYAKMRLWKQFDQLVAKGPDLPYDYIKRGCAQSTLQTLLGAIAPEPVVMDDWPERFQQSRRELLHSYIADSPWTCLLLHMLSGPDADLAYNELAKIITPDDMLLYLRRARVNGRPILTDEPIELLPQTLQRRSFPISPLAVAALLLALSIVGCFRFSGPIDVVLLSVQSLLGLIEAYVVFVSDLPASSWNWLLIPFNPLPLVFWKWRRYWALPFAIVLLGWLGGMLFAPHRLTDPAFYLLTAACLVMYAKLAIAPRLGSRSATARDPVKSGA